jgi:hypothetical protein
VSVAVLGNESFDVTGIDDETVTFADASAVRCALEDSLPADGIQDLVCKFRTRDITFPAEGSDCEELTLTGVLADGTGTEIEGSDLACLPSEPTCEGS